MIGPLRGTISLILNEISELPIKSSRSLPPVSRASSFGYVAIPNADVSPVFTKTFISC